MTGKCMNKMGRIFCILLCMVTVATCFSAAVPITKCGPWTKGSHIPVLINLYPNHGGTADDAKKAVEAASRILKPANIHLRPVGDVKVIGQNDGGPNYWGGDDSARGGSAGDGDLTDASGIDEGDLVVNYGDKELLDSSRNKNPGKGIKVSFVRTPMVGQETIVGFAMHRQNTVVVKFQDTILKTGLTIAHEIGHLLTLSKEHKILDKNNDGDCDDDGDVKSDSDGHAPEGFGPYKDGNLMTPGCRGQGAYLSSEQIKEIWKRAKVKGKCSYQWESMYAAIKRKDQFGTITDNLGDQNPSSLMYDIRKVYLSSMYEEDNIDAQVSVSGVLPTDEEIYAQYSLGFNIDDDPGTGVTYAGTDGIDRIVYITTTGTINLGTFVIRSEVEDTSLNTTDFLPTSPVVDVDLKLTNLGLSSPSGTSFLFSIPKTMLSCSAVDIAVVVTAGDSTHICDTAGFIFDLERWLKDPTFTTFGTGIPARGGNYPFEISGLEPNSLFDLYVDHRLVLSDMLDPTGGFSGGFVFPSDLPNTEMYFLTAQDSTGEFAYSITCPAPIGGYSWELIPTNKLESLPPYIVSVSTIMIAATAIAIYVKRAKHRKEKQQALYCIDYPLFLAQRNRTCFHSTFICASPQECSSSALGP